MFSKIDNIAQRLGSRQILAPDDRFDALEDAICLSNEIMRVLLPQDARGQQWNSNLKEGDEAILRVISAKKFPNYKSQSWFETHPAMVGERLALFHFDELDAPFESKFYWLNKTASKARITAGVMLTPNWEDSELHHFPNYKVGIDFFLTADCRSLLFVISNAKHLRVMELNGRLSNTQRDILQNLRGVLGCDKIGEQEPQRTIHTTLWNALQLKEVNKKFYEGIAEHFQTLLQHLMSAQGGSKLPDDAKLFASRLLGRLLFIWFLRKKSLINEECGYFDVQALSGSDYYAQQLKNLFFATLNTPLNERSAGDEHTPYLNGGLFEAHENDWFDEMVSFPSDWFKTLYNHFDEFNFTTDESTPEYEQIAIDPEMMGRVFENLLATQRDETGKEARKAKGTFYTPREIVSYMCKESLRQYLYAALDTMQMSGISAEKLHQGVDKLLDTDDATWEESHSNSKRDLWGDTNRGVSENVIKAMDNLKMLDPACGSGAFPMGMVQLLMKSYSRLKGEVEGKQTSFDPYKTKFNIVRNNIFGVDIEPMAVEISRLRVWLSLVVDKDTTKTKPSDFEPLPNLEFKFVCANSLIPLKDSEGDNILEIFANFEAEREDELAQLRDAYYAKTEPKQKITTKKRYLAIRDDDELYNSDNVSERVKQIRHWDPFDTRIPANFFDADKMFGVRGGFDIVIGNPPYVGEKGHKDIFDVIKRGGLGRQFYMGKMDLFYFFFHLALSALKLKGICSFITTNYYPTANGACNLRQDFKDRAYVQALINLNELTIFESAKGQHNLITVLQRMNIANKESELKTTEIYANVKKSLDNAELSVLLQGRSALASTSKVLESSIYDGNECYIRFAGAASDANLTRVLDKVALIGKPLVKFCYVNQGIVTGADKFTDAHKKKFPQIEAVKGEGIFVFPKGQLEKLGIPTGYIKPWFKNSDITRWTTSEVSCEELFYSVGVKQLTPGALQYYERFRPLLSSRREFVDGSRTWYDIHWGRSPKIFLGPKIVAPQRSKLNTFAYNDMPWYASADVYFITLLENSQIDLKFLLGVLNSRLMYVWLYNRGKRKGEMLELYGTPLSEIPIAIGSADQQTKVVELVNEIMAVKSASVDADVTALESQIDALVYDLYFPGSMDEPLSANDPELPTKAEAIKLIEGEDKV